MTSGVQTNEIKSINKCWNKGRHLLEKYNYANLLGVFVCLFLMFNAHVGP